MAHVTDDLSAFADGELPAGERLRVEDHLKACARCRAELDDLRAVSQAFKELPKAALPPGFMNRLRRRREEESGPAAAFPPAFFPMQARVAVVALSCLAVTLIVYRGARRMPAGLGPPEDASSSMESAGRLDAGGETPRPTGQEESLSRLSERYADDAAGAGAGFKGRAKGEPVVAAAKPSRGGETNRSLQGFLQSEKDRMGIQNVLPLGEAAREAAERPQERRTIDETRAFMRLRAQAISRMVESRRAPTVPIGGGKKPKLLSKPEDAHASAGAPLAEDKASGALGRSGASAGGAGGVSGGASLYSAPRPAAGPAASRMGAEGGEADASAPIPEPEAFILKTRVDAERLRGRFPGLILPEVDFTQDMAVVLMRRGGPPIRIVSAQAEDGRLRVRYGSAAVAAIRGRMDETFDVQVLPRADLPLALERAEGTAR